MKLLSICAAQTEPHAQGRFNNGLTDAVEAAFSGKLQLRGTRIEAGYDVPEERDKFFWADVVLVQFPVFWFGPPSSLQRYMEQVFERGRFFVRAEPYGTGGQLAGRHYLLSSTWNAPRAAFDDPRQFMDGRSPDGILSGIHKALQYIGLAPLESFQVFDVIRSPDFERARKDLLTHLERVLRPSAT